MHYCTMLQPHADYQPSYTYGSHHQEGVILRSSEVIIEVIIEARRNPGRGQAALGVRYSLLSLPLPNPSLRPAVEQAKGAAKGNKDKDKDKGGKDSKQKDASKKDKKSRDKEKKSKGKDKDQDRDKKEKKSKK